MSLTVGYHFKYTISGYLTHFTCNIGTTLKWSKKSKGQMVGCICLFLYVHVRFLIAGPPLFPQTSPGPVAHLTSQVWNMQKARWGKRKKATLKWSRNNAVLLICMVLLRSAPAASLRTTVSILQFAISVGRCLWYRKALCGSSQHEEQKPMLTTHSLNAYSSCHCRVIL